MLNKLKLEHHQKKYLRETILVWAVVILVIHVLSVLQGMSSIILQILGSLSAIVLIYPPVLLAMFQKRDIPYWQINRSVFLHNLKWGMVAVGAVFPAAFVVNHFYQSLVWGVFYHPATTQIWLSYTTTQLLLVAFPEEFFFRGYMQGNLNRILPPQNKFMGVPFGWAQILTAIFFAFSHSIIHVQWWHVFIFFPALVFSWLKEKTGTIWAAVLFHATCNVFSFWVVASYG